MLPFIQSDADFLLISRRSLTLARPLLFLPAGAHPTVPSLSRRPRRSHCPAVRPPALRPRALHCLVLLLLHLNREVEVIMDLKV